MTPAAPGSSFRSDPAAWIARLGRELRRAGVECAITEAVGAVDALAHLDATDSAELHVGLRSVFLSDESQAAAFDRCFWRLWSENTPAGGSRTEERGEEGTGGRARSGGGEERPARRTRSPGSDGRRAGRTAPDPGSSPTPSGPAREGEDPEARAGAVYSPVESIARRSFETVDESELREFDAWMDRLVLRLATRRSRRFRPARRRGRIDVRRSLRDAPRHDGELIRLARRRRRIERPRIVLLCDISGSMERYSRFLLRFLLSSGRTRDIETFAFSTRLVHLTPWLARARVDEALAELRGRGWSSGTRIGSCLQEFLDRHGRRLLGRRTVVIILSDGLDQGETEPLVRAMRRLQRRARRVIWLNPLLESSRYAPEARGMRAALPYIDEFASGHSLEALARLPELIRL